MCIISLEVLKKNWDLKPCDVFLGRNPNMRDKASITGNVRSFPQSVTEVIFEETFIITNLRSFKLHMKVYYTVTTVIKTFYMKLYSRFLASEKYSILFLYVCPCLTQFWFRDKKICITCLIVLKSWINALAWIFLRMILGI